MDLIFKHAIACPERIALTNSSKSVSYLALRKAVVAFSAQLRSLGIGPGDRVPVLTTRCIEGIVSILGVLAAGACYVPVDAESWSKGRTDATIEALQARVLVSTINTYSSDMATLQWTDEFWNEHINLDHRTPPPTGIEDLAYIIFTSGTTGKPKGVMISAQSLLHYVQQVPFNLAVREEDTVLLIMSIAFDGSHAFIPRASSS